MLDGVVRNLTISVWLVAVSVLPVRADDPLGAITSPELIQAIRASAASDLPGVERILASWSGMILGAGSLEYVVERNKPGDPVYERLLWREDGARYYYDLDSVYKGRQNIRQTGAFDGTTAFFLTPQDRQLLVQKTPLDLSILRAYFTPFYPFQFLKTDGSRMMLSDFKRGSNVLRSLAERGVILGEQNFEDRRCLAMRVKGGYDPLLKEPVDYDVFLDPENGFFPIGWKEYDRDGVMIKKYFARKLESLPGTFEKIPFLYPAESVVWQCKSGGEFTVNGKPVKYFGFAEEFLINEISVNLSDPEFAIDPATADTVYDADSGVWMNVPR